MRDVAASSCFVTAFVAYSRLIIVARHFHASQNSTSAAPCRQATAKSLISSRFSHPALKKSLFFRPFLWFGLAFAFRVRYSFLRPECFCSKNGVVRSRLTPGTGATQNKVERKSGGKTLDGSQAFEQDKDRVPHGRENRLTEENRSVVF